MEAFGMAANIFQRSVASQKRVDEVLLEQAGILDPKQPKRLLRDSVPKIEVKNLTFRYPGASRPILENVSFTVMPGMRVGIAGQVGSGKSTLLACLARMEPVPPGTIFFDGVDVLDLPLTDVRRRIAFVPQENFLFSRTIEANILYGSHETDPLTAEERLTRAREAARLASIESEIERLPAGFGTRLGERGVNLSGGQRQRLTIARALARRPQILLLDDCMSAIDAETERKLIGGIRQASTGVSLLLSSHRRSSFESLDWLVLLDEGKVVAQGEPRTLAEKSGFFTELERKEELGSLGLLK